MLAIECKQTVPVTILELLGLCTRGCQACMPQLSCLKALLSELHCQRFAIAADKSGTWMLC